jgi:hypothetical protein
MLRIVTHKAERNLKAGCNLAGRIGIIAEQDSFTGRRGRVTGRGESLRGQRTISRLPRHWVIAACRVATPSFE